MPSLPNGVFAWPRIGNTCESPFSARRTYVPTSNRASLGRRGRPRRPCRARPAPRRAPPRVRARWRDPRPLPPFAKNAFATPKARNLPPPGERGVEMRGLEGKTAVVTGGATLIGAAVVRAFAERGTNV